MPRRCWTCNSEHDLDQACRKSEAARTRREAGPGDDWSSDDLFDDVHSFGPVFTASYETDDSCCGNGIEPGELIRADGRGGWIHAENGCEVRAS